MKDDGVADAKISKGGDGIEEGEREGEVSRAATSTKRGTQG